LDESQLTDGKVGISWKILEHNDRAVIQFIVAGPSKVAVVGQGSVEGDPTIRIVATKNRLPIWTIWALECFSLLGLGATLSLGRKEVREERAESLELQRVINDLSAGPHVPEEGRILLDSLKHQAAAPRSSMLKVAVLSIVYLGFAVMGIWARLSLFSSIPLPFN
jgi:hypothetical protein